MNWKSLGTPDLDYTLLNGKLGRLWKEAVKANWCAIPPSACSDLRKPRRTSDRITQHPIQVSNQLPPKYENRALSLHSAIKKVWLWKMDWDGPVKQPATADISWHMDVGAACPLTGAYKLYLQDPLLSSVTSRTFRLGLPLLGAFVATETRICPSALKLQIRILKRQNMTAL